MTMKNNIHSIEIYEKPRCPNCIKMRKVFDKWVEKNPDAKFETFSAIENKSFLAENLSLIHISEPTRPY